MVRREDELPFSGEIDSHPFATHAANQSRPSNKDITSVSRCSQIGEAVLKRFEDLRRKIALCQGLILAKSTKLL